MSKMHWFYTFQTEGVNLQHHERQAQFPNKHLFPLGVRRRFEPLAATLQNAATTATGWWKLRGSRAHIDARGSLAICHLVPIGSGMFGLDFHQGPGKPVISRVITYRGEKPRLHMYQAI